MGAIFDYRIYRDIEMEELRKKWNDDVEEDLYENGHSYSGSIGMLGSRFVLKSEKGSKELAIEYIEENHDKWDAPMCVPFPGGYVIGGWCSS